MNKTEKQKFAIIAKQSQDEGIKGNSANILASKAALKNLGFSATAEEESEEVDPANSMEGAVFEIGDSTESFYHSDKQIPEENYFQINEINPSPLPFGFGSLHLLNFFVTTKLLYCITSSCIHKACT